MPSPCNFPGCTVKHSCFGTERGKPTRCAKHRTNYMIDVKHKWCEHPGCTTRPTFGVELGKPTRCVQHILDDMEDVVSRRCQYPGCKTRPAFGLDWGKPTRCAEHNSDGMENVVSARCEHLGCKKQPSFGIEWGKPTCCADHNVDNLENVVSNRCEHPDCKKQPSFGLEWGKPTRCLEHILGDMEDVMNRQCQYQGCKTRPTFGVELGKPTRCLEHILGDMEDVINRQCQYPGCKTQPNFGLVGGQPTRCAEHSNEGMEDLMSKRCKQQGCGKFVGSKYDGYCLRCYIHVFPDQQISRNYHIKEAHFVNALKASGILEGLDADRLAFDKTLGGCSRRRPDIFIDMLTHVLILENDEEQHVGYSCENKRKMELFQDAGNRPMVLLRFNPDGYVNAAGEKIPSCFKWHKTLGVPMIKDQDAWQARIDAFVELVKHHMAHVPEKEVTEESMFYDAV